MPNFRLTLAYDGTRYHGWQIQENADTVQGQVEAAVERLYGRHITVNGCSRTDRGVHANEFCCNFRTDKDIGCDNTVRALNTFLPDDIAVGKCEIVSDDFHARFDCKSKEYIYVIKNSRIRDPFTVNRALQYKYPMDIEKMIHAAPMYMGTHDFTSFCASGSTVKSNIRTVKNSEMIIRENDVVFRVEADGFLYNMVRIMVGTLLYISEGKIGADDIPMIIESKNRLNAGITAPACGLYLNKVNYEL